MSNKNNDTVQISLNADRTVKASKMKQDIIADCSITPAGGAV